ncbi:biotin/lipoyl-binding protein [Ascidiaceihabitans sp.]|uniref:HlyD family secretion protein n=1 Tax=Ascidiaceihabitans sp. TaxID=1872644 RepID=UPI0032983C1A
MNIRHECPMPELSFSVAAPLHLHKENGCKLIADRWSLAGVWLAPDDDDLSGDIYLSVPFQGVDVSFPVVLKATDVPGHYTFHKLTIRQRETLGAFYKGVLSGQMVSTNDIITSLDTPVDLVPMGETEQEETAGQAKAKPRLLRALWNVAFYLAGAAFLVLFLGAQIWQRLSHVQLDHARFVAPIAEYKAPEAGYLTRINVAVGDQVKPGDILARIEDPDRESDVEDVRAEVLLAERRLRIERNRVAEHRLQRKAQHAALLAWFQTLWIPWRINDRHVLVYPDQIETARLALYNFERQRDPNAMGSFDMLDMLEETVTERDLDLRRWKRELRHRKAAADELVVRAKFEGTVFGVYALKGSYIARDDLVVEIEDNTPRMAVGWIDDSMATTVHIGMTADISYVFRGQTKHNQGQVIDIQAGTDIAQPDKFGMVITIQADGAGLKKTRKWFRRNAPARIRLKRGLFASWFERDNGRS